MGSALCDGIESVRVIVWRCHRCKRRRRTKMYDRYDSFLLTCSKGHRFVSSDEGMVYLGGAAKGGRRGTAA